ncbi:hypothetical protein F5Y15DRAFT_369728 [Xylariaceae sp. FL0016]|nr:hypothetical protein F5Y15DRAFT_369728 [Xylariaceae sp. FL0016]
MASPPEPFTEGAPSLIKDVTGAQWVPLYQKPCTFDRDIFLKVMMNLIRNPNINSSWLFRADILLETGPAQEPAQGPLSPKPSIVRFVDFDLDRFLVRKLIPRNTLRDQPLDQTCLIYHNKGIDEEEISRTMVVYKPHVSSHTEMPFYHPKIQGLAFLHEWNGQAKQGTISIHYHFFDDHSPSPKLVRTGLHLLSTLSKHGEGQKAGYVKRVQHDTVIPQPVVQNTYMKLKEKYARPLIQGWAEGTDPVKHVFEDLGIAAFLIELWAQMYCDAEFPGFVDIGCGNGLLVYILRQEGFSGWGFDARQRKSWAAYSSLSRADVSNEDVPSLRQHILLPVLVTQKPDAADRTLDNLDELENPSLIHNGLFPKGTFIISNHADELTPWTPILATLSDCPFLMIPCCSHDFSGARYRAPAPKKVGKSASAYSSLVEWVAQIATECGWDVEREMLRIPSTRNTGLLGRRRTDDALSPDLQGILDRYGGTGSYLDNVMKLVKTAPRGH